MWTWKALCCFARCRQVCLCEPCVSILCSIYSALYLYSPARPMYGPIQYFRSACAHKLDHIKYKHSAFFVLKLIQQWKYFLRDKPHTILVIFSRDPVCLKRRRLPIIKQKTANTLKYAPLPVFYLLSVYSSCCEIASSPRALSEGTLDAGVEWEEEGWRRRCEGATQTGDEGYMKDTYSASLGSGENRWCYDSSVSLQRFFSTNVHLSGQLAVTSASACGEEPHSGKI